MSAALRNCFVLLLLLLLPATASAQTKPYKDQELDQISREFEDYLKAQWPTAGADAQGWLKRANAAVKAKDFRRATGHFASAAVLDGANADTWLALARAYLAIETADANEKQSFPRSASSTAYLAYQRAKTPALKAEALAVLGEALARRARWRAAIDAYKASLEITPSAVVKAAYDQLRGEHGFRMLDYTVDSDAASPRLCIQFSEPLSKTETDFSKYVTVNGGAAASVRAQGQQLCVEELLHGRRYEVKLRSGLPSSLPREDLLKTVDLTIYVRDRSPSVRFTGRSYVLPRTGQQGIPLISVNTAKIEVEIYQVGDRRLAQEVLDGDFGQQIGGYKTELLKQAQGERLWSGSMTVKSTLNEDATTAFPIDELLPKLKPGLYIITASASEKPGEEWRERATQWFVVSDMGLTAFTGADGVHAMVRSLATAKPMADVELRLIARNNEVLATAKTDARGYVLFDAGLARGSGGLAPALVVARGPDNDYGFLDLTKSAFDLSDRGVGGRINPGALDAMLFTERGVYRPGEKLHLTALLRDASGRALGMPLTVKFRRPDGVEARSEVLSDAGDGGRSFTLDLPQTAMTGTWRITAHSDPKSAPIGEVAFLVEDYVPERLEMTLASRSETIAPGKPAKFSLEGRYLYGAPAAGLGLEGEVIVAPAKAGLAAHPGYSFGLDNESVAPQRQALSALPNTDANGKAEIEVTLTALPQTAKPLEAKTVIRLREPSGRTIEKAITLPVALQQPVIGVKPLFEGHVAEGEPARFDLIALDAAAKAIARPLKWELMKLETRFQWYSRDGRWDYEAVEYVRKVANGTAETKAGEPVRIEMPVSYGAYRLEVSDAGDPTIVSSVAFSSGWFVSETSDAPDILELALDKARYKPGETANVRILGRMAGEALVAVVSDRLLEMKTVSIGEGGGETSFTVDASWGAGAYVSAILYRPMDANAKRMPGRAVGVKWLPLDVSDRTLSVSLGAPKDARPNQRLSVPLTLSGLGDGEKAHVTVAAVDVGILNLTNYKPPKPDEHYFGQRRLGLEIRDLYGRLIDGMQGARGQIRSGGDGGMSISGRPLSAEPVALYSGIVEVTGGKAEVSFDIPAFDGTVRLMATAWSKEKLGHGVKDVIVRDPVVLSATPPRFLSVGDVSQMHISLHNVEGDGGAYEFTATAGGGLAINGAAKRTVDLKPGERTELRLPLSGSALGKGTIRLALAGPGGYAAERSFTLEVSPPAPNVTRRSVQDLAAKTGALRLDQALIADLIPETVKVTLTAGSMAGFDVPGLLLSLDRYPYGCAEQTVSQALPLLYFKEVAEAAGLAGPAGADKRIAGAIERVASLQDSNGSFGLWSAGSQDLWLTAYVTDFLTRAQEKGHKVPGLVLNSALDRLKNSVNAAEDFENGGEELAYALYVLARAGRAVVGDLRYYADTKIEAFATPLAKAQIGAALALYGDKERAERAFKAALDALEPEPEPEFMATRLDFGTSRRDSAATISLIAESGVMPASITLLRDRVTRRNREPVVPTTQENAWLLMAAKALIEGSEDLKLTLNGAAVTGRVQKAYSAADLQAGVTLANRGDASVPVSVVVSGASVSPEPEAANGFTIERTAYTTDGREASLSKVTQNSRFVIVVKVRENEAKLGHVVVEDRIPAGFEIENPRLVGSADLSAFSWLKADHPPVHAQFRDDRFVAAFNFTDESRTEPAELTLAYIVRAVTPGTYAHPGAVVEDMYRPGRFARSAPAMVEIAAGR